MIFISLVWPQLRGGYFSTSQTFEIIDLTGIIWFSTLSETLMSEWRTFTTFIQPIIFNNGSTYYHCSNNLFQLLKNKNRSQCVENWESQHWTCLVCSDKSTVSSAEMQYYSSISVGPRDPSLVNTITSRSTVYVINTTV